MEPKSDPKRTKIDDEKEDAQRSPSRSFWGGLGAVLEGSLAILAELEAILGRFGVGWEGQNHCFSLCFSILFENPTFCIKMVILAGLGAILGELGASWIDLGPIWEPKRDQKGAQDDPKMTPKRHLFQHQFLEELGCEKRGGREGNLSRAWCGGRRSSRAAWRL